MIFFEKLFASGKFTKVVAGARQAMDHFFAELVLRYELLFLTETGVTFYRDVCDSSLDELIELTQNGSKDYIKLLALFG